MSFFDRFARFARRKDHDQQYGQVSEEEDKMLPEQTQSNAGLVELQRSNKNLKRILGILIATFLVFAALLLLREHRTDKLMIPQLLRTPVPPSQSFTKRYLQSRTLMGFEQCQ